jgi:hypothetical protein
MYNCIHVYKYSLLSSKYFFYRANILFIEQILSSKYLLYRAFKFHRLSNTNQVIALSFSKYLISFHANNWDLFMQEITT